MFLDFCESVHDLLWADFGVYLCGLYISVTKHFGHDFDGDAAAQGDCGCKGVSANVGCEVLAYLSFFLYVGELAVVCREIEEGQTVVVPFQYLDDGREQRHIILCAGLNTGSARNDDIPVVFFGPGEVGGHKVGIAETSVTLDEKKIESLTA